MEHDIRWVVVGVERWRTDVPKPAITTQFENWLWERQAVSAKHTERWCMGKQIGKVSNVCRQVGSKA